MDLSLQVCNIGWGLGCGHGVGKDELLSLLPINVFLARLPETILFPVFSSRIPAPNPLPEFLLLG